MVRLLFSSDIPAVQSKLLDAVCKTISHQAQALFDVFKPPPQQQHALPPLPRLSDLLASADTVAPWLMGILGAAMNVAIVEDEDGGYEATQFARDSGNVRARHFYQPDVSHGTSRPQTGPVCW